MSTAYCFDLDGTLTTTELLPRIAAEAGVAEEMETLTRVTMDGLIPFRDSLRLRALVLGVVPVETVWEVVKETPLDERLVDFIHERRESCFIVTGNLDTWLRPIASDLPCELVSSRASFQGGRLHVDHVLDKGRATKDIRARGFSRVIGVGDGANDVPMFEECDLSIAYAGVHQPARAASQVADFVVFEGGRLCQLLTAL
jgi:HAD superfamily phosphoserine phosphatase-like hydrolase